MPPSRLRRITRERRRFALVTLCVLAGLVLARGPDGGLAVPVALAVSAGLCIGALALARPALRGYGEAVALASLTFGVLDFVRPGTALDLTGADGSTLAAGAVWIALVAMFRRARRALGALPQPRRRRLRLKTRATSSLTVQSLWHGLVPQAGETRPGHDPDFTTISDMGLRLGRVQLMTQPATDLAHGARLQVLEIEPPFHIRLKAGGQDPRALIGASGESEIFFVDLGATRLVLFSHTFCELPLGRAMLAWLDDAPGRMLDRRLDDVERAALDADAPPVSRSRVPPIARHRRGQSGVDRTEAIAAWEADAARDEDGADDRAAAHQAPAQDTCDTEPRRKVS